MRIESFWAKGFRSLRDVRLDGLGPFNVLYGPNGGGKSNILAAMDAWLRLITIGLDTSAPPIGLERTLGARAIHHASAPLREHDISLHSPLRVITLGGVLADLEADMKRTEIEVNIDATVSMRPTLSCKVMVDGVRLEGANLRSGTNRNMLAALGSKAWERNFSLIAADRMPRAQPRGELPPEGAEPLAWYFRRGQIKDALFAAQNAPSPVLVRALDQFRKLMAGPPLYRPPFRAAEDPHTMIRDLREQLPPPFDGQDISLDLAGLGIAQIYWILAQATLSGADMVAVEEPEAHLHAPTSGRHLRELLKRLVDEKHIDQLFIATHSNLFDLDPNRYFDVSLENGETVVRPKDLTHIDDHLYEPGPAKHALQRMLQHMPPDEIMFRRGNGVPVSAGEMLGLLQADDPLAVDFLKDVHGAAVTMVKVAKKKGK
jgi:hypothetical protein